MFKLYRLLLVLTCLFVCNGALAVNLISGVRAWAGPENTRLVLDLAGRPDYSYFTLPNPDRLVVDLKNAGNRVDLSKVTLPGKLIKRIRPSTPKVKGQFRLVIELSQRVKPTLFPLAPAGHYGNRLVIDLPDEQGKAKATASQTQVIKSQEQLASNRDILIAIDAGHGGEDPGAIGPRRTYEKTVTLAIAKRLARLINAERGMQAALIRKGDYFINLNKRSELARESRADMLISIHADGFNSPKPSGASVWVLSMRRANTEIGRWLENHEQQSDLLGGAGELLTHSDSDQYLTHALLDMSMEHSMNTGYEVGSDILSELGRVATLHKTEPEHASLAVLKSPDIPSVLIEAGFITNPKEEKLLNNGSHQEKLAKAIFNGLTHHYREKPPLNTLYASRYSVRRHKVKRGESLSLLASRYHVSVAMIKKANKLSSDLLRIGQVLSIPNS